MLRLRVRRLLAAGPRAIAGKVARRVTSRWTSDAERRRALREGTRVAGPPPVLRPLFDRVEPDAYARLGADRVVAVADLFVAHRFDLLGSGWVRVAHGMRCRGLEGRVFPPEPGLDADREGRWLEPRISGANAEGARRTWSLVDDGYVPIDWQLDFKSGFRWDERLWHGHITYGDVPGADVKVPWELARGQHLPQLAIAHVLARSGHGGPGAAERYAREVRNQILDFIAQNPPAFGVNWSCTMDVAIRIVNWIVAYDLLRSEGASFDDAFEDEFARSVAEHAAFIAEHLEWEPTLRANHYLADIVGLLVCASVLEPSPRTDAWLAFSIRELVAEAALQFHPDGTNFEASTCYHRLSAEMLIYATAVVLGLEKDRLDPPPAFDASYIERLGRAARFVTHVTKPDGRVVQIGDNDNGRLLKPDPARRRMTVSEARERYANLDGYAELADDDTFWDEDHLDHRHLVDTFAVLLGASGGPVPATFDGALVRAIARGRTVGAREPAPAASSLGDASELPATSARAETVFAIPGGGGREGLETFAYPGFGVFVLRSARAFVTVRCGVVGQKGNGGHAHNDQLSVCVCIDGIDVAADPGAYLYTPIPERRNEYRSARAHNGPRIGTGEPGRLDMLFRLPDAAFAECLSFGPDGFLGRHRGFGPYVYRRVTLEEGAVRVVDAADAPLEPAAFGGGPPASPGYGLRLRVHAPAPPESLSSDV